MRPTSAGPMLLRWPEAFAAPLDVQHRDAFVFHHLQLQEHFALACAGDAKALHGDVDGAEIESLEPRARRPCDDPPLRSAGMEHLECFLVFGP